MIEALISLVIGLLSATTANIIASKIGGIKPAVGSKQSLLLATICFLAVLVHGLQAGIECNLAAGIYIAILAACGAIDLQRRLVYPSVVMTGILASLLLNPLLCNTNLTNTLVGLLEGLIVFTLIFAIGIMIFRASALGVGDILLAAMIGGMVGARSALAALILGVVLAGVYATLLLITGKASRKSYFAFGAPLCVAAIVVISLNLGK